jgi:hypothetical protein
LKAIWIQNTVNCHVYISGSEKKAKSLNGMLLMKKLFLLPGNSNRGTGYIADTFLSSLKSMLLISQSEFFLQPGNSSRGTGSSGKVPEQPEEHAIIQSVRILFAARQQQQRNAGTRYLADKFRSSL